ncbi:hypothetical protein [Thalassotalea mangrovi]|uniref:Uncharacterized protein n=1 Tax=Thalassotalea mangrovi TaxID=2572245 RepID=A0A4U1B848_9GAMM|nr:hypothetical protein [Thalassotalea mangrovi]TKB46113.1 hypothetical protein E8M12_05655 [Thalassotalea mangrovi]
MKKTIISSVFALIAFSATAEEGYEVEYSEEAPLSYVEQVVDTCKIYAEEDEVSAADMNRYLLECVNDDLEMSGYKKLAALPNT